MSAEEQRGHATHEALDNAIEASRRRREERTRAAQLVAEVRNRLAAPSEAIARAAREAIEERPTTDPGRAERGRVFRELKAELSTIAAAQARPFSPTAAFEAPADTPLALPACLSVATRCQAPPPEPAVDFLQGGQSLCSAADALLKLYHASHGLGGWLGVEAIPAVAPVSGSLFYAFVPPSSGYLSLAAEVSITGTINALTTLTSIFGELPTIYADASLTLRVTVYQDASAQSSQVQADARHSLFYPGNLSVFANDMYVVPATVPLGTTNPVVVEVEAELYSFGRSDYGYAEIDFSNDTPGGMDAGIRVPVLCLSLTPFSPIA